LNRNDYGGSLGFFVSAILKQLNIGESLTYTSYENAKSMHKDGFPLMNVVLREAHLSPDDDIKDDFVSIRLKRVFEHFMSE